MREENYSILLSKWSTNKINIQIKQKSSTNNHPIWKLQIIAAATGGRVLGKKSASCWPCARATIAAHNDGGSCKTHKNTPNEKSLNWIETKVCAHACVRACAVDFIVTIIFHLFICLFLVCFCFGGVLLWFVVFFLTALVCLCD